MNRIQNTTKSIRYASWLLAGSALVGAAATAQTLDVIFVADSSLDGVVRCEDLNADGDYNDAGEITAFYDENTAGVPHTMGNPAAMSAAPDGRIFVGDSSEDAIFALIDLDGDGDAEDAGECYKYFDGDETVNLSSVTMGSPNGIFYVAANPSAGYPYETMWVANASTSAPNFDVVIKLEDINGDGDMNDLNEATIYADWGAGSHLPQDILVGNDGKLYMLDAPAPSSGLTKGIFVLDDADSSGTIDINTEVLTYYVPSPRPNNPFHWAIAQDAAGAFYMADTLNELVWRVQDLDSSGAIDNLTEETEWYTVPGSSNIWDVVPDSAGGVYCAESQTPDRLLYLDDANSSGTIEVGEDAEIYNDTISPVSIGNPRGMIMYVGPAQASTSWRNGGTNWDVYTVPDPPVLGTTITAEIDVATTGFTFTQLFGYEDPLTVTIGPKKTVLVNITGGELLGLLLESGPNATYFINIPSLLVLEGYQLSTQAAVFDLSGPPLPWNLTNAQDWVLGY